MNEAQNLHLIALLLKKTIFLFAVAFVREKASCAQRGSKDDFYLLALCTNTKNICCSLQFFK